MKGGGGNWFTENYGGKLHEHKKLLQIQNALKLDVIRTEIDNLNLTDIDKSVILTSLILALDKVSNTIGHYVSYLNEWCPRSYNNLLLTLPKRFLIKTKNSVIKDDIFNTIHTNNFDLAYFDPPYGSNNLKMPSSRVRYASYYHFWTTVILNDKPKLFGKANRRMDSKDALNKCVFEDFRSNNEGKLITLTALENLIKESQSHYVLLSYSSNGKIPKEQLFNVLNDNGKLLQFYEIDYKKNVMSSMTTVKKWIADNIKNREYLFLLKKF